MNMLDDEGDDTFHGTRESYSYLSDVEWSEVERISSIVGKEAVWSLLSSRDRDQPALHNRQVLAARTCHVASRSDLAVSAHSPVD